LLACSTAVGVIGLPPDLETLAGKLSDAAGLSADLALAALVATGVLSVPLVAWLSFPVGAAARWARARLALRWLCIGLGAPLSLALNVLISPGSNPSLHLYLSWVTAILLGNALWALRWPGLGARRWPRAVLALLSAAGLWALFGPHANSVMIQTARRPSALHLVAVYHTNDDHGDLSTVELTLLSRAGPFFRRRDSLPALPPRPGLPSVARPIAIFFSFDSLRADVLQKHPEFLPNLVQVIENGTSFDQARTPGSMTKYTLGSVSMSNYFSQQLWSRKGGRVWPFDDDGRHVAQLLSTGNVLTANFPATKWMRATTGLLKGFEVEELSGKPLPGGPKHWIDGVSLTDRLIGVLEKSAPERSVFAWVHYLDSHSPFRRAGRRGSLQKRYLRSLRVVDAQLGRVLRALDDLGLNDRTLLIVTSDHGEAFGEHGSKFHGGTLYDELLRVPLAIRGPGVAARRVSTPVSLVDLGPTLLDWFGQATPGAFMGESLMPFLLGGERTFQRPIAAETRLKRMLLFADGYKVIEDVRRKTLELYDLGADPGELHNLADGIDPDGERHVLLMRSFFQLHRHHRDYRVPYVK
jgi:hypothetical protein